VDPAVGLGVVSVGVTIVAQVAWSRGPARPAQVVGFSQLAFGLSVVAATALGVALA
jgi:hypothetical protein